jgi:hypothetical protein
MSKKRAMDTLCSYDRVVDWIPHRITRRQALAMAADGRFPQFVRAYTRAEPLWREGDIVDWIAAHYRKLLPDFVARLEQEGFTGKPSFNCERT